MFAIPVYTSFDFPFQIMDVSKFKDGRVHFGNSVMRELNIIPISSYTMLGLHISRCPIVITLSVISQFDFLCIFPDITRLGVWVYLVRRVFAYHK